MHIIPLPRCFAWTSGWCCGVARVRKGLRCGHLMGMPFRSWFLPYSVKSFVKTMIPLITCVLLNFAFLRTWGHCPKNKEPNEHWKPHVGPLTYKVIYATFLSFSLYIYISHVYAYKYIYMCACRYIWRCKRSQEVQRPSIAQTEPVGCLYERKFTQFTIYMSTPI